MSFTVMLSEAKHLHVNRRNHSEMLHFVQHDNEYHDLPRYNGRHGRDTIYRVPTMNSLRSMQYQCKARQDLAFQEVAHSVLAKDRANPRHHAVRGSAGSAHSSNCRAPAAGRPRSPTRG